MTPFTETELAYLALDTGAPRLGRVATVGEDGTPHVAPVGWSFNEAEGTIDIGGHTMERTKKFRDVQRSRRAAVVIDDLASVDPWRPRGIEIRGAAEAIGEPRALIRVHPERVLSWGLERPE